MGLILERELLQPKLTGNIRPGTVSKYKTEICKKGAHWNEVFATGPHAVDVGPIFTRTAGSRSFFNDPLRRWNESLSCRRSRPDRIVVQSFNIEHVRHGNS